MENSNMKDQFSGSAGLEAAKAMFADWKKSHQKTTKTKPTREEILKKYFVPREEKEIFRPIHSNLNEKYIKTAFFHEVRVNQPNGKKKRRRIYCPAHNDPKVQAVDNNNNPVFNENGEPVMVPVKCPLCEKAKAIKAKQNMEAMKPIFEKMKKKEDLTESEKKIKEENDKIYKLFKSYEAKEFYIIKGIDRGSEKDGPKFWRFKFNGKQQGVADKLVPVLSDFTEMNKVHFADPEKGADVIVNVVENTIPGSNYTYKDVSSVSTRPPSPLHTDSLIAEKWMSDESTWRDVYKPASAPHMDSKTYLQRVATGTDPYWDDSDPKNKKWVYPDPNDKELEVKANTRDQNLDATSESNFEQASDLEENAVKTVMNSDQPKISDMSEESAGQYNDDAENITQSEVNQKPEKNTETKVSDVIDDVNVDDIESLDLPF
jgi:hypothetical protein